MIFDLICFKLPSPDFKTDLFKRSFTYAIQCVMTILIFLLSQIEAVVDFLTLYFWMNYVPALVQQVLIWRAFLVCH